ncbi:MAG: iron-containing alcohol dehydrogenase [Betaproteobacteria bacterium]|nr:iron-containing alcohol dehydrogenase [Betaproteobacteria bacterium]
MMPLIQYPRVLFDFGAVRALPEELAQFKIARPLFVTDPGLVRHGVFDKVRAAMPAGSTLAVFDQTPENPTVDGVERALALYRERGCDGLVAVGGGSVIDTAKAAAVVAGLGGKVDDYLGHPERITASVVSLIAVPTTSGTGSEVSRGAGIHSTSSSRGSSIGGPWVVPRVAICDPELTLTLPKFMTAGTGMDALSHAVEGYLAKAVNPVGDAMALDAVKRAWAWLPRAVDNGADREARWQMMMASMQAMLTAKGLGSAHALANTFGDQGLHHGTLVTMALPAVLRLLAPRLPERMSALAGAMMLAPGENPADALGAMNARLGLPRTLREYGYKMTDINESATDAHQSFFNIPAPYHPTLAEYRSLIEAMLG